MFDYNFTFLLKLINDEWNTYFILKLFLINKLDLFKLLLIDFSVKNLYVLF